jgi:hypothetical protein
MSFGKWTQKPPGTYFNKSAFEHLVNGKLVFASIFNASNPQGCIDLANNVVPEVASSANDVVRMTPSRGRMVYEQQADATDTDNLYLDYGDRDIYDLPSTVDRVCILARIRSRTNDHDNWARFVGVRTTGGGTLQWGLGRLNVTSNNNPFIEAGGANTSAAYTWPNDTWVTLFGSQQGTGAAERYCYVWEEDGTETSANSAGTAIAAGVNMVVGGRYAEARSFDGQFDYIYVWVPNASSSDYTSGASSWEPLQKIKNDPYQFSRKFKFNSTFFHAAAPTSTTMSMPRRNGFPIPYKQNLVAAFYNVGGSWVDVVNQVWGSAIGDNPPARAKDWYVQTDTQTSKTGGSHERVDFGTYADGHGIHGATSNELTIVARVRPTSYETTFLRIITVGETAGGNGAGGWALFVIEDSTTFTPGCNWVIDGSTVVNASDPVNTETSKWMDIACSYKEGDSGGSLYLNGLYNSISTSSATFPTGADQVSIGNWNWDGTATARQFIGDIEYVLVWDKKLPDAVAMRMRGPQVRRMLKPLQRMIHTGAASLQPHNVVMPRWV